MSIKENLIDTYKTIEESAKKASRNKEDITLIAVSKTKPIEMLEEAYEAGIREFGENKVQELTDKYEKLPKDIHWHMIGHLQTNKVKYIVDKAYLIHSVDSIKLAKEISKEAVKKNVVSNVLIEVNMAEEESKFGVSKDDTLPLIEEIAKLPGIKVRGLMTVAPYVEDAEENRLIFCKIRQLFIDIKEKNIDNVSMDFMSMGMSGDYSVAVEEGATHVRVGTKIFGEREYNI
ncbi:MAG: YggS family pyridoxal phosphate-dependent enzyme [Lachnospiraceae bacterium]|nr:YggS family pyridoxal phosphate-dependent enzyme [Lachnospiraceae bacterium]